MNFRRSGIVLTAAIVVVVLVGSGCSDNRTDEAKELLDLGNERFELSDLDRAEQHYAEALAIYREIGHRLGEANALGNLGAVHFQQGDLDRAEQHHRDALNIQREIGNRLSEANQLGNLGLLAAKRSEREQARELLTEVLRIYDETGAGGDGPETVRQMLTDLGE